MKETFEEYTYILSAFFLITLTKLAVAFDIEQSRLSKNEKRIVSERILPKRVNLFDLN